MTEARDVRRWDRFEVANNTDQMPTSFVDAAAYSALRAEHDRLTDQLAGMVAPEELRRWKAECEWLRAEIAWRKGETAKLRLDLEDRESQVQALRQALERLAEKWEDCHPLEALKPLENILRAEVLAQASRELQAALALPGEAAPTWTDGMNAAGRYRFDCDECHVRGVIVDEDGCCQGCGHDARRVAAPKETQG